MPTRGTVAGRGGCTPALAAIAWASCCAMTRRPALRRIAICRLRITIRDRFGSTHSRTTAACMSRTRPWRMRPAPASPTTCHRVSPLGRCQPDGSGRARTPGLLGRGASRLANWATLVWHAKKAWACVIHTKTRLHRLQHSATEVPQSLKNDQANLKDNLLVMYRYRLA